MGPYELIGLNNGATPLTQTQISYHLFLQRNDWYFFIIYHFSIAFLYLADTHQLILLLLIVYFNQYAVIEESYYLIEDGLIRIPDGFGFQFLLVGLYVQKDVRVVPVLSL